MSVRNITNRLKFSGQEIGDDGTAALVVAQECHPHLRILGINQTPLEHCNLAL